MDIVKSKKKKSRPWWLAGVLLAALFLAVWAQDKDNLPEVRGDQLRMGSVKRGELLREIRGHGSLQPANPHFITALSAGVVKRVHVRPGDRVDPETVLLTLENPALVQVHEEAALEVTSAEATLEAERARSQRERTVDFPSTGAIVPRPCQPHGVIPENC